MPTNYGNIGASVYRFLWITRVKISVDWEAVEFQNVTAVTCASEAVIFFSASIAVALRTCLPHCSVALIGVLRGLFTSIFLNHCGIARIIKPLNFACAYFLNL